MRNFGFAETSQFLFKNKSGISTYKKVRVITVTVPSSWNSELQGSLVILKI